MLFEKGGIKGVFHKKIGGEYPKLFTREKARTVRNFHKTMDNYKETPLVSLDNLAEELGLGKIFIKD